MLDPHHHQQLMNPIDQNNQNSNRPNLNPSILSSPNIRQVIVQPNLPPSPPTTLFDPLPTLRSRRSRLRQADLKLVPPPNFGSVETWLYRSGEPSDLSFEFLSSLELKTLLWLAPRPPSIRFRDFLVNGGVRIYDLGILHAAAIDAVTQEAVTDALRLILNPQLYPLMIMCAGGSHRTGTVVGCLRKLQGWNLASIFEEYRRYAGAQHHIMNEQFIEFYDTCRLTGTFSSGVRPTAEPVVGSSSSSSASASPDPAVVKRATPADEMGRSHQSG